MASTIRVYAAAISAEAFRGGHLLAPLYQGVLEELCSTPPGGAHGGAVMGLAVGACARHLLSRWLRFPSGSCLWGQPCFWRCPLPGGSGICVLFGVGVVPVRCWRRQQGHAAPERFVHAQGGLECLSLSAGHFGCFLSLLMCLACYVERTVGLGLSRQFLCAIGRAPWGGPCPRSACLIGCVTASLWLLSRWAVWNRKVCAHTPPEGWRPRPLSWGCVRAGRCTAASWASPLFFVQTCLRDTSAGSLSQSVLSVAFGHA